jgi:hypothetical protein
MSQTLEERFSKIKLSVQVSDFTPLTRYLGEVHQACELSQPKVPGDEVQCVKRLHAGLSGTDTSTATATFKLQLDTAFAGRLPATINKYLLEVDRQYGLAARADALSRMYSGQRIGKSHNNRDSDEPGGRGGGGGGGGKGGGVAAAVVPAVARVVEVAAVPHKASSASVASAPAAAQTTT